MSVCPYCNQTGMKDWGDKESSIALVGSAPSEEELHYLKMFYGATGQIFRREMLKYSGLEISDCLVTSVYVHDKPKKREDARCIALGYDLCLEKVLTKKIVVLIGADAVRWATGLSIDDVNGLDVTDAVGITMQKSREDVDEDTKESSVEYYDEGVDIGDTKFIALVNPSSTWSSGLGELRFGLTQLKQLLKEEMKNA